ncbi:MAG: hypothetical protein Q9168_004582 [Polycauliona sp. 1 TL-2023]
MKSIIVSAVLGTAFLAFHGVGAAVLPLDVSKPSEALAARSEAMAEAHAPAIKRAESASAGSMTPFAASIKIPETSSTTTCVHTTDGFIECGDIMHKREDNAMPESDILEKRDDPTFEHLAPRPRGGLAKRMASNNGVVDGSQKAHQHEARAESTAAGTTSSSTASQNASPGCHGKGKDFFFQNKDWCISELVRGIPEYLQAHPGFIWNLAFMGECFEYATCTGGLSFVE